MAAKVTSGRGVLRVMAAGGAVAAAFFLMPQASLPQYHHVMPGGYRIPPQFRRVSLPAVTAMGDLLPAARNCLSNWIEGGAGSRLRIVSDDSVPGIVVDAFSRAALDRGHRVELRNVPMEDLDSRHVGDLEEGQFDATLLLAYFPESGVPATGERFVRVVSVPELLASEWARTPLSLMQAIARETQRAAARGRLARLTDPAGTDYSFAYSVERMDERKLRRSLLAHFPPRFQVALRVEDEGRAGGWIASHSSFSGFFPLGRLRVEGGMLTAVQGGGSLGERLKADLIDPDRRVRFTGLRLSTSPAALRYSHGYTGSTWRWGHEAASQRAGVASFRFRSAAAAGGPAREHGFQVYFPTLTLEGRTLVEEGHLKTFEHPEVTRLAASLGAGGLLVPQCGAESLPILPDHQNPTVRAVNSADDLRGPVQSMLRDWVRLGPDERVALLTDQSVPPLLFGAVLEQVGTRPGFALLDVEAPPPPEHAAARLEAYRQFRLPETVWEQMAAADVVVALSHFPWDRLSRGNRSFHQWLENSRTRFVAAAGLPEYFVSPWGEFPVPLLRQLARYTVSRARLARTATLSTGEGSLSFDFQPPRSIPAILPEPGAFAYHPAPANYYFLLPLSGLDSAQGTITTRRVEGMPVLPLTLTVEAGRVSRVEGGADAGDWIRRQSESGSGLQLRGVGTFVNPKAFPWESSPYPGWTPAFWSLAGNTFRSGIVHIEFEGSARFAVQLQLARLELGTRELISQGRLLTLEDPNLHRFASRQGLDAERWLTEDWVPLIGARQ